MRKLFAAMVVLLLTGCERYVPEDVTELVYATPYPPSHPFSRADQVWMDFVARQSGSSLVIRPSWSGALLSSEHSMLELRHGLADIGLITPIYVKGGVHLIRIQSGFYSGITSIEAQIALYQCLAAQDEQFAREVEGLKILAIQGGSLPGIVTANRPVASLADLQGLRIRAPTELLSVLEQLGADPVNMPMGDVYSALAKGVLDGVVAPLDTFRSLHFAEVAQYYASLVVPRGAYPARAMNMARWSALSPAHQQVLEAAIPVWQQALAQQIELAMQEGLAEAQAQDVIFSEITADDQQRFDALYLDFARQNADSLQRYGIDGSRVFSLARNSINSDGSVTCSGDSN